MPDPITVMIVDDHEMVRNGAKGYLEAQPEIAVVAFVYNGGEGATVAGPIVRQLLEAYFELKAGDIAAQNP